MNLKSILNSLSYWLLPPNVKNTLLSIYSKQVAFKDYRVERDIISRLCKKNSKFKDIHNGERCFILATGPSIKTQNLRPLKNELGDQKYLDCWPDKFPNDVHILQKQEWMLAPWNATRFPYNGGKVYHFHSLRILGKEKIHIGDYPLPNPLLEYVYRPYSKTLHQVIDELRSQDFLIKPQREIPEFSVITQLKIYLANKLRNLLTYKQQPVIDLHDEF